MDFDDEVIADLRASLHVYNDTPDSRIEHAVEGSFLLARVRLRVALSRLWRAVKADCRLLSITEGKAKLAKPGKQLHEQSLQLAKTTRYSLPLIEAVQKGLKAGIPGHRHGKLTDDEVYQLTPVKLERMAMYNVME
jgi:hypothetical protein